MFQAISQPSRKVQRESLIFPIAKKRKEKKNGKENCVSLLLCPYIVFFIFPIMPLASHSSVVMLKLSKEPY